MTEQIFTVDELTNKLGLSKRTIEDSIRNGKLKATKLFKKWFVKNSDLIEFIEREGEPNKSV
ncbi:helix-turn-helix domain-containing protein (plasmid) [Bernardetia sp. OM2101]|uniref:helix-turn-helix domain-containing protein n=1 Tax=Bernardetia sp. OM2101 TaxID=3344876 RepID=UPI0035D02056